MVQVSDKTITDMVCLQKAAINSTDKTQENTDY
jgi:hypothetical protein